MPVIQRGLHVQKVRLSSPGGCLPCFDSPLPIRQSNGHSNTHNLFVAVSIPFLKKTHHFIVFHENYPPHAGTLFPLSLVVWLSISILNNYFICFLRINQNQKHFNVFSKKAPVIPPFSTPATFDISIH
jgi:hypothetical protein